MFEVKISYIEHTAEGIEIEERLYTIHQALERDVKYWVAEARTTNRRRGLLAKHYMNRARRSKTEMLFWLAKLPEN